MMRSAPPTQKYPRQSPHPENDEAEVMNFMSQLQQQQQHSQDQKPSRKSGSVVPAPQHSPQHPPQHPPQQQPARSVQHHAHQQPHQQPHQQLQSQEHVTQHSEHQQSSQPSYPSHTPRPSIHDHPGYMHQSEYRGQLPRDSPQAEISRPATPPRVAHHPAPSSTVKTSPVDSRQRTASSSMTGHTGSLTARAVAASYPAQSDGQIVSTVNRGAPRSLSVLNLLNEPEPESRDHSPQILKDDDRGTTVPNEHAPTTPPVVQQPVFSQVYRQEGIAVPPIMPMLPPTSFNSTFADRPSSQDETSSAAYAHPSEPAPATKVTKEKLSKAGKEKPVKEKPPKPVKDKVVKPKKERAVKGSKKAGVLALDEPEVSFSDVPDVAPQPNTTMEGPPHSGQKHVMEGGRDSPVTVPLKKARLEDGPVRTFLEQETVAREDHRANIVSHVTMEARPVTASPDHSAIEPRKNDDRVPRGPSPAPGHTEQSRMPLKTEQVEVQQGGQIFVIERQTQEPVSITKGDVAPSAHAFDHSGHVQGNAVPEKKQSPPSVPAALTLTKAYGLLDGPLSDVVEVPKVSSVRSTETTKEISASAGADISSSHVDKKPSKKKFVVSGQETAKIQKTSKGPAVTQKTKNLDSEALPSSRENSQGPAAQSKKPAPLHPKKQSNLAHDGQGEATTRRTTSHPKASTLITEQNVIHDDSLDSERAVHVKNGAPAASKAENQESEGLYCICRTPYDKSRFMIACDGCDDWFHGDCVGVAEKDSDMVDKYYCKRCEGKKKSD
ncbi:JmjC domain-containing histone demethylation protein 1 [Gryganskiella cystojenkinii]|nr:JmjC domain-containing histone demethylation protein 1 [Gryganskiella cystojenkinii]